MSQYDADAQSMGFRSSEELADYQRRAAVSAAQPGAVGETALPMDTAPKDATMLRLLVEFEEGSFEDDPAPCWTIGTNHMANTSVDEWLFAGWNWTHDCFTQGTGKPIGWLPLLAAAPTEAKPAPAHCQACGDIATRHLPEEATGFPGPYCDNCPSGQEAKPGTQQAEGWVMVPAEPTNEMVFEGAQCGEVLDYDLAAHVYRAMLSARPSAPTAVEPDGQAEFARRYEWLRAQVWNENTLAVVLRPKDNTKLGCFLPFGKLLDDAIDHMSASKGTPL